MDERERQRQEYRERNEKNKVKQLLMIAGLLFVVMLAIDTIIIRVIDKREENNPFVVNIAEKTLSNIDSGEETADPQGYSTILERELTQEERVVQRKYTAQRSILMYNNIGLAEDFVLPDGTWFLNEDMIYIDFSLKAEDGNKDRVILGLDDPKLLECYRGYWKDSFYSYDKTAKMMVEKYRYYQLVFDRFYVDGMTILPEQVSIYKVERLPLGNADYSEITGCELMETVQYEVPNKEELRCCELVTEINTETVAGLSYEYTCDGEEGYRVLKDCTLNGKVFSLEKRRMLLQECLDETYNSKDRDWTGFSNYYYRESTKNSELLGGDVKIVLCEQNLWYNAYRYAWRLVTLVVVLELVVSLGIAAIVIAIKISKQKQ